MDEDNVSSNFAIRCLPENVTCPVQRSKLVEGSELFADMFACCDVEGEEKTPHCMDIHESATNMTILIRLLQEPPSRIPETNSRKPLTNQDSEATPPIIPHQLLPRLFVLADKYLLKPPIMQVLESHLGAQASTAPLLVYGLATRHSLPEVADKASEFLTLTPLETCSVEDVKVIPTIEAYHRILQLQNHRKRQLKEVLMREELFPHGYGGCSTHKARAEEMWDRARREILPDLHSGTPVAGIMSCRLDNALNGCKFCKKAWIAATEMLDYKCKKIVRRISHLDKQGY